MYRLAAFADEISPHLDEQIEGCLAQGIRYIELRGIEGRNVADFTTEFCQDVKQRLGQRGLQVISIGSPIGKVRLDDDEEAHFDKFTRCVEIAELLGAPFIRVFSYYRTVAGTFSFQDIVSRFQRKVDYVAHRPVTLLHENEKDIYGESADACLRLLKAVNSPKLRAAFDFANFIQVGQHTWPAWQTLQDYVVHFHIKDALAVTGRVVPPGQGDAKIGRVLQDAQRFVPGAFLSLEPHLSAEGSFSGFSGPDLFATAAQGLIDLLETEGLSFEK